MLMRGYPLPFWAIRDHCLVYIIRPPQCSSRDISCGILHTLDAFLSFAAQMSMVFLSLFLTVHIALKLLSFR